MGVSGYANLMNKNANESQPDFALSKEDFPTLGGAINQLSQNQQQTNNNTANNQQLPNQTTNAMNKPPGVGLVGGVPPNLNQQPMNPAVQQNLNQNFNQENNNNNQAQLQQVSLENALRKEVNNT